jgi:glycine betaine/proline transport system substrate-binding protein
MLVCFKRIVLALILVSTFCFAAPAQANQKIKIASVGWTGVTAKTELAVAILKSLGYDAENVMVSVPVAYKAMASGDADAFLGNWMPSMETIANKYFEDGSVVKYVANMPGANYTLAVPTYCAEGGLKDFTDIEKFGDKLDWKIYGIEAGNDGNEIINAMIKDNKFGLGKFKLVPSSETGMLAQVQSFAKEGKWIVFLGWSPHSMNELVDMTYLTGSDASTFGADNGTATVWTNLRKGFAEENPNVAKLLKNMTFSIPMMNQIMTNLHEHKTLTPRQASLEWVKAHPEVYEAWLKGVVTIDGKPGAPAFKASLKNIQ